MREPTGVLVADDDPLVRTLLETVLEESGLSVTTAADGDEALLLAFEAMPAVVVLDVKLPCRSGYEVCRELRRRYGSDVAILFLTGVRTESFDRDAGLLLGADDYFVKPFDPADIVAAVRAHAKRVRGQGRALQLTPREREVLGLLAEGLTQNEIADRLTISPRTVATHIDHILAKLGVRNRAQAVAVVYRELSVA